MEDRCEIDVRYGRVRVGVDRGSQEKGQEGRGKGGDERNGTGRGGVRLVGGGRVGSMCIIANLLCTHTNSSACGWKMQKCTLYYGV